MRSMSIAAMSATADRAALNEKIFHNKTEWKQIKIFVLQMFGEQHSGKQQNIDGRCRFTRIACSRFRDGIIKICCKCAKSAFSFVNIYRNHNLVWLCSACICSCAHVHATEPMSFWSTVLCGHVFTVCFFIRVLCILGFDGMKPWAQRVMLDSIWNFPLGK